MKLPEALLTQSKDRDKVISLGSSMAVLLRRDFETEKSQIVLNQNVITFGLKGYKHFHSSIEDLILHQGEAMFLKKGLLLTTEKVLKEGLYEAIVFFLDDQILSDFFDQHKQHFHKSGTESESLTYFKVQTDKVLEHYIQSLLPFFEDQELLSPPLFNIKIHELLLYLLTRNETGFKHFLEMINLQVNLGIKQFMEKNFKRNLTVEDFAHLFGTSLSSFKREFERAFETTPASWIKSRRLQESQTLLLHSDFNVSQVAYEVGFENSSHFVQSFRKAYGTTPMKFKQTKK